MSLKKTTLKGMAFLGAGKSAARLISFINTLILARILSPEDYGLMAMAMVVTGFISFFNEIGLGTAIIQRKEISEQQLTGAFTLSILMSLGLYGLVYLGATPVANFYENSIIEPILQVLAITFILGAISTVSDALLNRNMSYKTIAGIEFFSILLHCAVTLGFALAGFKTWSLVYGYIASQLSRTLLLLHCCHWKPTSLGYIKDAIELVKFGLMVTYSRITWYAYTNASTFIIGKVSGEKQLGIFSMATTIADLATAHITSLIRQVASPLFAKLQDDYSALNHALCRLTGGLALITFPMLIGMAVTAPELVYILLGDKWMAAVFPLQALTIIGLLKSIDPLLTQALTSSGQVSITARYTSICAVVVPLAVYIGASKEGINGAAIALSTAYPILMVMLLLLCRSKLQLPVIFYLKQLVTPTLASIFMVLSVMIVGAFLPEHVLPILSLLIKVLIGFISYLFFIIYIRTDGIEKVYEVLLEMGLSKHKLSRWPFNSVVKKTTN